MSANPLASALAALLESAASALLTLDDDARYGLLPLAGQSLLLELTLLPATSPLALRISCHGPDGPANRAGDGGSLSIMAESGHNQVPPNTIVRGRVADLVAALTSDELPAGISIEGDEALLMALRRCFSGLTPDWQARIETLLAPVIDQAPGNRGQILRDVIGQAELAFDTLKVAFGGAFQESRQQADETANKFLANEDDLDVFATRLENLQLAVDRLNAQMQHLDPSDNPSEQHS